MASSSRSAGNCIYDVFLSFRGEDTRKNFVDHLYAALDRTGIRTFKDDEKLRRGESIGPELIKAIEESSCTVVVFSKNYANSSWCLGELAKIMECRVQRGQKVLPVFYKIDPSDVRGQKRSFETAFQQHEERYKEEMDKVRKWREDLTAAANLSGWDVAKTADGHEAECIRQIVSEILRHRKSHPIIDKKLVGMESRVQKLMSLLGKESNDVRRIGIWGMGGMGKTTIAQAVFELIKDEFEGSSFLKDVRQNSSSNEGLKSLQKKLLSEILMEKDVSLRDCDDGAYEIQKRLNRKKVLLVLDDVDDGEQLEFLAGSSKWFGPGSRIMITTRDMHLIREFIIYEHELLNDEEATELFCIRAFDSNKPRDGFEKVTSDVVKYYTGRLPLALKVLGSHLRGRDHGIWGNAMKVLDKVKNSKIHDILKLSFDGLNILEKNIFLDIACFFKGQGRNHVTQILDCCDFEPEFEIQVLVEKSLVTIDSKDMIQMHDLILDMGRHIARESYANSRLWLKEEISEVMRTNTRLEAVEAIYVDSTRWHEIQDENYNGEVIRSMKKLRLLHVYNRFTSSNITHVPDELKWLRWDEYPFDTFSLSTATGRSKLASLDMLTNHMEQLSLGETILHSLKFINLTMSLNLTKFPDVSGAPNLERLILKYCSRLVEVHESVGSLKRLVYLNLSGCIKLKTLPSSLSMKSLQTLILSRCDLERLPEISGDMGRLSFVDLYDCYPLKELPSSFRFLTALTMLDLRKCIRLRSLPNTICHFSCLKVLKLDLCDKLEELTELPSSIQVLEARCCASLRKIGDLSNKYTWLYKISIFRCPKLLESDGDTQSYLANFFRKSFVQKCAVANHRLSITIPGREVPDWFSDQRFGNKIALKLSPSYHTTIKGFAICSVLPAGPGRPDLSITFKLEDGDQDLVDHLNHQSPVRGDEELHVWISYIPFDMFLEKIYHDMRPEDWSQFDEPYLLMSLSSFPVPLVCGGCIIYKEEVEDMPKVTEPFLPDCTNFRPYNVDSWGEYDIADVLMMKDSLHEKSVHMAL